MHKARLKRLHRLFADQPVCFITICTHDRKRLLDKNYVHEAFTSFAQQAVSRGVFLGSYVLMPDHLHLFVAFSSKAASVSLWIKSLKNSLSKTLRLENIPAPHWQKGFFDHVLRSEESYAEKWDYVARNPVRAGLVKCPEDWPFRGEIHVLSVL
jgi:putative transposase